MKQNNYTKLLGSAVLNIYNENGPKITKHAIVAINWLIDDGKCQD